MRGSHAHRALITTGLFFEFERRDRVNDVLDFLLGRKRFSIGVQISVLVLFVILVVIDKFIVEVLRILTK